MKRPRPRISNWGEVTRTTRGSMRLNNMFTATEAAASIEQPVIATGKVFRIKGRAMQVTRITMQGDSVTVQFGKVTGGRA